VFGLVVDHPNDVAGYVEAGLDGAEFLRGDASADEFFRSVTASGLRQAFLPEQTGQPAQTTRA